VTKKKGMSLTKKENLTGWMFLAPAVILIVIMSFVPMVQAVILSFQKSNGVASSWVGLDNYARMFQDGVFKQAMFNTFLYLIIQVPIMLILALIFATMLNNKDLRFKGVFRTAIFLPCATSLVSYALIFNALFQQNGFINNMLVNMGIFSEPYNFFNHPGTARAIIIIALVWRWTGYNMVFYLAGLQNIDYSIYEAAKIDGASPLQSFWKITVPLLKPMILLTAIMSTNGTLQLFDESVNLTAGGPSNQTITMSHYIYNMSFLKSPKLGYAAAMAICILVLVAILALIQMKVGDKRE
jgi:lactose/L-arabinose transport system permease protein